MKPTRKKLIIKTLRGDDIRCQTGFCVQQYMYVREYEGVFPGKQ